MPPRLDGVLVIDKPAGPTSHDVVVWARRVLRERRIGHTGTLDPLATGVLPLAVGRATRLTRFLSADDKVYEAEIRLGATSDTDDATGRIAEREEMRRPDRAQVEAALDGYRGTFLQTPPAYSAKKIAGERAYARARRQEPVALTPAPARVRRLELLVFGADRLAILIEASAGFYVRSLARDLGERLGCGAYLGSLRRVKSGTFTIDRAITPLEAERLGEALADRLVPLAGLLVEVPAAVVEAEGARRVALGRDLAREHVLAPPAHPEGPPSPPAGREGLVRILDGGGALLAVARPAHLRDGREVLHPLVVLV